MRIAIYLFIIIGLIACNQDSENKRHEQLIGFKSSFLAENGEETYFQLESEIGEIEINYLNDIINVTLIIEANTCANYDGDISIENEVITLKYYNTNANGEVCTSESIYRFTYIIDNPAIKTYQFKEM